MHVGAVSVLLLRHHKSQRITDLLKRLDKDKLVGTLCFSDPATGETLQLEVFSSINVGS